MTLRLGRYFVLADFRICRAISRCTLATVSCLLLPKALARQLSSVSTCCADMGRTTAHVAKADNSLLIFRLFDFYLNVKFLEPISLPSAKTLTLYVPGLRTSFTFQYIVTGVSLPVYSMVFLMEYCRLRFS